MKKYSVKVSLFYKVGDFEVLGQNCPNKRHAVQPWRVSEDLSQSSPEFLHFAVSGIGLLCVMIIRIREFLRG
jgi:hypothetical protein